MKLKKVIFVIFIIASLFAINNLIHSIYNLWQKDSLVTKARDDLSHEKQKNQELKKKLAVVENPQFVEEEARNKLFLAKPGEGIVIIPSDYLKATGSGERSSADTRPNWKKWWDLFF